LLRSHLGSDQPIGERSVAAEVLAKAKLNVNQLSALTEALKSVGPTELDRVLEALSQTTDERVGHLIVAALKAAPNRASLRSNIIKERLAKFNQPVQQEAEELYALLDVDAAKQRERLEQLLTSLKEGDIRRGQAVFMGSKTAC